MIFHGLHGETVSLIDNERTKLLANALDRASTACFTVGILTPTAGFLADYHRRRLACCDCCTTFDSETSSRKAEAMSYSDPMFWFTSLGLPAIVIVGAYIAVLLHERSLKR